MRGSVDTGLELEGLVESPDGAADELARDVAGDLDRGRRHDLYRDALRVEGGEGLRGDPGMALHSGSDQAHLPEVVARRPLDAEALEDGLDLGPLLRRRREDALRARLDDRVHGR